MNGLKGCVLALGILLTAPASGAETQTIATAAGELEGRTGDGVTAFLGIPYAAPPTGALRWRPPQPVVEWQGVRQALDYGSDCAQAPFPPDAAPIRTTPAEDCLFLNVWKPAAAGTDARNPVLVWIHGGGFVNGGTSPAIYSGVQFARAGIVFVSLNYRLGRYGFFAHPALEEEGFGGNFGFLDQIAALRWVQENISAFGGDPSRVTVFGESAGGVSVHMLLQSPRARGLFSGAIIQSGAGRDTQPATPTFAQAARAGRTFAPGLSAQELRSLPQERVTGNLSLTDMNPATYAGPMRDGRTLFGLPLDAIEGGLYADVPVIVGANSADGFPATTDKDRIFASFGEDAIRAQELYDPSSDTDGLEVATLTHADQLFIEPARAVARALAACGHDVWLYRFAHVGVTYGPGMGGAPHATEIPYVFDLWERRRDPLDSGHDDAVAERTHGLWVEFARTGRPVSEASSSAWPRATPSDTRVLRIDSEGAVHVEDPRTAHLDFVEARATRAHSSHPRE